MIKDIIKSIMMIMLIMIIGIFIFAVITQSTSMKESNFKIVTINVPQDYKHNESLIYLRDCEWVSRGYFIEPIKKDK